MSASRLPFALGVSVVLHGGAFAALHSLPRGWQPGQLPGTSLSAGALQASLRARPADEPGLAPVSFAPAPKSAKRHAARAAGAPGVYYPAHLLDERPLVRTHVEPEFPPHAGAAEGRVSIRLYIDEQGRVEEVQLVDADPAGAFEASATRAFAAARFTPGRKAGVAVKSVLSIEVLFGAPVPLAGPHASADAPR